MNGGLMGSGSWLSSLLDSGWMDNLLGSAQNQGAMNALSQSSAPKNNFMRDFLNSMGGKGSWGSPGGIAGNLVNLSPPGGGSSGAYQGGFVDNSKGDDAMSGISTILSIIAAFV